MPKRLWTEVSRNRPGFKVCGPIVSGEEVFADFLNLQSCHPNEDTIGGGNVHMVYLGFDQV